MNLFYCTTSQIFFNRFIMLFCIRLFLLLLFIDLNDNIIHKLNRKFCNEGIRGKYGCDCKGLFLVGKYCNSNPYPCKANATHKCLHLITVKPEDVINQIQIYNNLKNNEFVVFKNNDTFLGFGNTSDTFVAFKYGQYVITTHLIGLYDSQLNYEGLSVPLVPSTAFDSIIDSVIESLKIILQGIEALKSRWTVSSIIIAIILVLLCIKRKNLIKMCEKCKRYFKHIFETTTPPNAESNSLTHGGQVVNHEIIPLKETR